MAQLPPPIDSYPDAPNTPPPIDSYPDASPISHQSAWHRLNDSVGRTLKALKAGGQNYDKELLNNVINIVNLAPDAANGILHHVGVHGSIPDIPTIQTKAGLSKDAADISAFVPAMATGVGAIEDAAKLPAAAKFLESGLGHFGKQVAGGTAAGLATSKDREAGAIGGGIGAGMGEAGAQGLSWLGREASKLGVADKMKDLMAAAYQLPSTSAEKLVQALGNRYMNAKNSVKSLYEGALNNLPDMQHDQKTPVYVDKLMRGLKPMQHNDFKNYHKLVTIDKSNKSITPRVANLLSKRYVGVDKDGKLSASPLNIHFLQSRLNSLKMNTIDPELKQAYHDYGNAIDNDLQTYLKKNNRLDDYKKADDEFKKRVLPFYDKKYQFMKKIADNLEGSTPLDDETGQVSAMLAPTTKMSDAVKQFMPTKNENDLGKMNKLSSLLGSKDEAATHLKNLMLESSRAGGENSNEIDSVKLLKNYNDLSNQQKDFIFNKDEQKNMDGLDRAIKESKSFGRLAKRAVTGGILGAGVGYGSSEFDHLSPLYSTMVGLGAGAGGLAVPRALEKAIMGSLLRDKTPEQLASKLLDKKVPKGIGKTAAIAGGIGSLEGK